MRNRQICISKQADKYIITLESWRTDNSTNLEIPSSRHDKELSITQSKMIRDIKANIYNKIYNCNHPIKTRS